MSREAQKVRSDSVRQAILDTALMIGLEEGFEAVSVRKIINKMKYSTGIVYHYFKDKQEVIDAVEMTETEKFHSVISQLIDPSEDSFSSMIKIFRRTMQLAFDEPEKYNLIVLHKYSRKKPSASPWIARITENLKHEMAAGHMRLMDAPKAAFSIWSSFLGFNLMISRMEGLTIEQAEALFDIQIDIIFKGVLKK